MKYQLVLLSWPFFIMDKLEIENDLHKLRRCLDMFEAMVKIDFQTPDGKNFKITLNESLTDIIKPEMKRVGHQLLQTKNKL